MEKITRDKPWFKEILKTPELQDITLRNLYEFYLVNDNIQKVLPIITSNSNISIRVLDWFVTNYSKKFNIIYQIGNKDDDSCDRFFNVYLQYKCQLKGYKKKLFDPFCRKQRIVFYYDHNKCAVTTVGQLNFFKWAIMYGVLNYVEKHLIEITNDMTNSNKMIVKKFKEAIVESDNDNDDNDDIVIKPYLKKKINKLDLSEKLSKSSTNDIINDSNNFINSSDSDKTRKKRHELSINANKTINIHNYSIVLTFD